MTKTLGKEKGHWKNMIRKAKHTYQLWTLTGANENYIWKIAHDMEPLEQKNIKRIDGLKTLKNRLPKSTLHYFLP